MAPVHKRVGLLLVLGLLIAPALSGCGGSGEPTLASAVSHSGVVEGVVDSLKADDDAAEVRRLRTEEPQSAQESEEAGDEREQAQMEAVQASQGEGPAAEGPAETAGEMEGEEG
jgi:outer membrane murein-binding lipoprotein Lpp